MLRVTIEPTDIGKQHYTYWGTTERAIERRRALGFPTRVPGPGDRVTAAGQGVGEADGEDGGEAADEGA